MDYDKLIERLKNAAGGSEGIKMCQDAALAIETLRADLARVTAERDTAVRDLKLCAGFGDSLCHFCKTDSEECSSCISGTRWQWRGPRGE